MLDAIFPIVEGHGEIRAVPELLRRLSYEKFRNYHLEVMKPFRLPRGRMLTERDLEKAVELEHESLLRTVVRGRFLFFWMLTTTAQRNWHQRCFNELPR